MDMFEHYEKLPIEVQAILDKYSEMENDYENCGNLVDELELVGWTCEYGLSAEPYDLRELSKFDGWTNEMVDKIFELILNEMSFEEAKDLRKSNAWDRNEKILYFIDSEDRFEAFFEKNFK